MISAGDGPSGIGNGLPPGGPGDPIEWDDEEERTNPKARADAPEPRFEGHRSDFAISAYGPFPPRSETKVTRGVPGPAPVDELEWDDEEIPTKSTGEPSVSAVANYAVVPPPIGRDYGIVGSATRPRFPESEIGRRSGYFRGIVEHFVEGLRVSASAAFPNLFARDVEPPERPNYAFFEKIEAASGAVIFIKMEEDRITVAGNIYAVANFIRPLYEEDIGAFAEYADDYSVGCLVSIIKQGYAMRYSFGGPNWVFRPARNGRTNKWEVVITQRSFPRAPLPLGRLIETFKKPQELFIEDEIRAIEPLLHLQTLLTVEAGEKGRRIATMLNKTRNILGFDEYMSKDRGESYWSSVGALVGRDGKVAAILLKFDEVKWIGSFITRKFKRYNQITFQGRPSLEEKSMVWEVFNTNPQISGAASFEKYRSMLQTLFVGDITHTYSEGSLPAPDRGGGSGAGSPVGTGGIQGFMSSGGGAAGASGRSPSFNGMMGACQYFQMPVTMPGSMFTTPVWTAAAGLTGWAPNIAAPAFVHGF